MIDLSTDWMGLHLGSPLVVSPNPYCQDLGRIRHMEDAGAAAVVLHSLFEEQIERESRLLDRELSLGADSFAESLTFLPEMNQFNLGPDAYLEHVRRAKDAVDIPVIGSLNGSTPGGWVRHAKLIEEAGADAIELNIYLMPGNLDAPGAVIEGQYRELVREVRHAVKIPLAVKLSHQFSAFGHFARTLVKSGANGIVLFNRFYQPDLDIDALEVLPTLALSTPDELPLRLTWTAMLYGRLEADIAITGGVHNATDVIKSVMAGAAIAQMASAILRYGIPHIAHVRRDLHAWLEHREYASIEQMRGSLSQRAIRNPDSYERANYLRVLSSYALT